MGRTIIAVSLLLPLAATAATQTPRSTETNTGGRVSVTVESRLADRDSGAAGEARLAIHPPLSPRRPDGRRERPSRKTVESGAHDFWVHDADTVLHGDADLDGHYRVLEVSFDVDTYFSSAEVYARIFLSYEGGPWDELHATADFTIFGTSASDDYYVETELVSGYPTGYYDVLIEIHDAWDGRLVADFGPGDTSALAALPLEDVHEDSVSDPGPPVSHSHEGGGGAAGPALALWLALIGVVRGRGAAAPGTRRLNRRRLASRRARPSPSPRRRRPRNGPVASAARSDRRRCARLPDRRRCRRHDNLRARR